MVLSSVSVKLRAGRLSSFWICLTASYTSSTVDLQVPRDRLVVVLLEVVEVLVDDGHLEVVVAEDLGLHVQALLEVRASRRRRGPTPASRAGRTRRLRGRCGTSRARSSMRQVRRLLAVRRARVPLRSRKPLSSRLPRTSSANFFSSSVKSLIWSCQRRWSTSDGALREVLLDGRQLLEAAAVAREGLLERAVLEELLPVDLLDPLVVARACRGPRPRPSRSVIAGESAAPAARS